MNSNGGCAGERKRPDEELKEERKRHLAVVTRVPFDAMQRVMRYTHKHPSITCFGNGQENLEVAIPKAIRQLFWYGQALEGNEKALHANAASRRMPGNTDVVAFIYGSVDE